MPLAPGSDRATISENISELTHHGSIPRPHRQIVAIALANADRHPHKADGGPIDLSYSAPLDRWELQRPPLTNGIGHNSPPSQAGPVSLTGDIGSAGLGRMPPMTVEYTHREPFSAGGIAGSGAPPHVKLLASPSKGIGGGPPHEMSPSQGTPWWTRSAAREGMHSGFADGGGVMSSSEASPWWERADARIMDQPFSGGLINSAGAGRTDRLPLAVGTESHVVTGDVVSGLGQGNTLAGARILSQALRVGPYGTALPHEIRGHGVPEPRPPTLPASETGLASGGHAHRVSILAAGGEFVIPADDWVDRDPQDGKQYVHRGVRSLGEGDLKRGHDLIDRMMKNVREHTIKFLRSAPLPKKSIGGAVGVL